MTVSQEAANAMREEGQCVSNERLHPWRWAGSPADLLWSPGTSLNVGEDLSSPPALARLSIRDDRRSRVMGANSPVPFSRDGSTPSHQ